MTARDTRAWERRRRAVPSTTVSLSGAVDLPVPVDAAWDFLQDTEAVAACIPGLEPDSIERIDDDTFRGSLRHLAMGVPSRWQLEAGVRRAPAERSFAVRLDGTEPRLGLTLGGDAQLWVRLGSDGPELAYAGELTVTGRLAEAGGPIIERVVASIIERFVENVRGAGTPGAPPSWWARLLDRLTRPFRRRGAGLTAPNGQP